MQRLIWYWRRWQAMEHGETFRHFRKKFYQAQDSRMRGGIPALTLQRTGPYPLLPKRELAPKEFLTAVAKDATDIMQGNWRLFSNVQAHVDDPPLWDKDYLAGRRIQTDSPGARLNHRHLPHGADIKLIWELSRWNQFVRLAQAAYLLKDTRARDKCIAWLEDWSQNNSPYRGWNWTSALETGIRLIQFTWLDAMLGLTQKQLSDILPAHVRFTWRMQSFGSSANNHLLGELAGLIIAASRWPDLQKFCAPLPKLQSLWQTEVLRQFAMDGGNREQALNYHLFSFELCWQTSVALEAAGYPVANGVKQRLAMAMPFYADMQVANDSWDYGDSDDAYVTPLFASSPVREWLHWMSGQPHGTIHYWLGTPPAKTSNPFVTPLERWRYYPQSGMASARCGQWRVRWDLSPLGYLRPAAHGHFDALHLSLWFEDIAIVIDPGTGAYYGDAALRTWLASCGAHNGPTPLSDFQPTRDGGFLWSSHHEQPAIGPIAPDSRMFVRTNKHRSDELCESTFTHQAELPLGGGVVRRTVQFVVNEDDEAEDKPVIQVRDGFDGPAGFTVRWQFPPGTRLERQGDRSFRLYRNDRIIAVDVSSDWSEVIAGNHAQAAEPMDGIVSPSFRRTAFGPFLRLTASGQQTGLFQTTFQAC